MALCSTSTRLFFNRERVVQYSSYYYSYWLGTTLLNNFDDDDGENGCKVVEKF